MSKSTKIFSFVAATLLLAYGIDIFFTFVFKSKGFEKVRWMTEIKKQKFDFAFTGNSRAYYMVQTDSLEKAWNKHGVNLSLEGSNTMEQYLLLNRFYSNHNSLSDLFIEWSVVHLTGITERTFNVRSLYRTYHFLPYIGSDDSIYKEFKYAYGPLKAFCWRYIPTYKYAEFNTTIGTWTVMNALAGKGEKGFNKKGDVSSPIDKTYKWKGKKEWVYKKNTIELNDAYIYLDKIMALCAMNHTRVHIYTAPAYYPAYSSCSKDFANVLNSNLLPLCSKYGADYKNFNNAEFCQQQQYFADDVHLNRIGLHGFMNNFKNSYFIDNNSLSAR